ncbi:hypothetical protein D9758_002203 [Tetrapyrgos nigripes]|uniref:Uncharacterized protein n=1 Tax=Tetrapyrgos nigripes TaxID=182062 RepID=A0A8H5GP99_9AGAR|nr:hypothetical protein D9758_002203 [Tetrapyrgos nigripes]
MSRHAISPPCSPSRKRQRVECSSPLVPDPELTEAELGALDEIEFKLSQTMSQQNSSRQSSSQMDNADPDNPFADAGPSNPPASKPAFTGFMTAAAVSSSQQGISQNWDRSSPDPHEEKDNSTWFEPASTSGLAGFQAASFTSASSLASKNDSFPSVGFKTGGGKGILAPSAAALAKAKEKMKEWEEDSIEGEEDTSAIPAATFQTASSMSFQAAQRPPFRSVENSVPDTPCPPEVARPSRSATPAFTSPLINSANRNRPKPFKTPFLTTPNPKASSPTPFKLPLQTPSSFVSARSQHPLSAAQVSTSFQTPVRPNPVASSFSSTGTPARKSTPAKFVTPFKPGMKPGQPGRKALDTPISAPAKKKIVSLFNLKRPAPSDRKTLASCGHPPPDFSGIDFSSSGIDIKDLQQINVNNAMFYRFYEASANSADGIGRTDAFNCLKMEAASLVTQEWIDNHWAFILWKLAGMVRLDPASESSSSPRWTWEEVHRQLLYRYEREMNQGIRPPLRRIVNQDTPASCPMVLCISDIIWSEPSTASDGTRIDPFPQLEVTDGWYRLRAEIDLPLARAVKHGIIRVGRKIAVVGARLQSERKDPMEILEAYNSVKLVICGNSSHLAPWDAKLGFQRAFNIATMHSLTPDGGLVPAMDLVVTKVYPIAFLELKVDENGKKMQEGPRNEADEAVQADAWKRKRGAEESRLRAEHEKKGRRYLGYAERLEHKCRGRLSGDEPPDNIDSLYDELEEPDDAGRTIARTNGQEAGWLAKYIRERIEKGDESIRDEIEKELDDVCPPRDIRSFRVIVVQDARTSQHPANRVAQLTVWDVLHVQLSESKPAGHFDIGNRVIVTNLLPSQKAAWQEHGPGDQIFLVSTRNSRWQKGTHSS